MPPGSRIRVLVVDDSAVVRTMMAHAFQHDPDIEIVGSAANGLLALRKIEELRPDVITLDIEMPEMNGLEMLQKLREASAEPFVIMFSTLTERGAEATLDALMLGANDYAAKPSQARSATDSVGALRDELGPKIRQFFQIGRAPVERTSHTSIPPMLGNASPVRVGSKSVLAIGVSTGGPNALSEILPRLPKSFPLPILIVQHMPPVFTRLLAERLNTISKLQVEEAVEGALVCPGKALIAPGGLHMRVKREHLNVVVALDESERRNSCRPSVDVLFESVNEVYGAGTIAAILTGMGQDGLQGAQALKAAGAYVIAQDENSSVVWGMPGFVVRAGLADSVLPLDAVPSELLRQTNGDGLPSLARRSS